MNDRSEHVDFDVEQHHQVRRLSHARPDRQVVTDQRAVPGAETIRALAEHHLFSALENQAEHRVVNGRLELAGNVVTQDMEPSPWRQQLSCLLRASWNKRQRPLDDAPELLAERNVALSLRRHRNHPAPLRRIRQELASLGQARFSVEP